MLQPLVEIIFLKVDISLVVEVVEQKHHQVHLLQVEKVVVEMVETNLMALLEALILVVEEDQDLEELVLQAVILLHLVVQE